MIIGSYAVVSNSERNYLSVEQSTTLLTTVENPAGTAENAQGNTTSAAGEAGDDTVSLSDMAKKMMEEAQTKNASLLKSAAQQIATAKTGGKVPRDPTELKLDMLEKLIQMMTGKRMRARRINLNTLGNERLQKAFDRINGMTVASNGSASSITQVMRTEQFKYESESVSYSAKGIINTADGQTITVDISMYMSREFMSYSGSTVQITCDPLIINYGGTAASLTEEKFEFDLTMDGVAERISFAGQGSGFLALDKNGDGVINDGSELFGPSGGSGFAELRAYDQDGNGWIDEADKVYSQLLVWSKDANGNDQLFTLKELGIGAIYLGDVETEFSLTGANNSKNGIIRSTSFFLTESGGAGTISHVDLML